MNLLLNRLKQNVCVIAFVFLALSSISAVEAQEPVVQRVRLNFTAPDGAVRQILLGFTSDNSATDGFDYGWDAINWDNFENDLNWMIGNTRCIIQGVGSFENTKTYPFGMFVGQTGQVRISLNSLENFDDDIPVYIHDTLENTYTQINTTDFIEIIENGDYTDRFYIAFSVPASGSLVLSDNDYEKDTPAIRYLNQTHELIVDANENILNLKIFDLSGKMVFQKNNIQSNHYKNHFKSASKASYVIAVETNLGNYSKVLCL